MAKETVKHVQVFNTLSRESNALHHPVFYVKKSSRKEDELLGNMYSDFLCDVFFSFQIVVPRIMGEWSDLLVGIARSFETEKMNITTTYSNESLGNETTSLYQAPQWVYQSSAVALFAIGFLGIGSNLVTIIVYLMEKVVSVYLFFISQSDAQKGPSGEIITFRFI